MSKMSKNIKKSFESINASDEQRDRMLDNIYKKTEQKKKYSKSSAIISVTKAALPLAACICIAVLGINFMTNKSVTPQTDSSNIDVKTESDNQEFVQIGSPITEVSGSSDIKEQLGIDIEAPQEAENTEYFIIDDQIADIRFVYNDKSYYIRASDQQGDFSGLSADVISEDQIDPENNATLYTLSSNDETYHKIEWSDGKFRYMLCSVDDINDNDIKAVYDIMK